ncbi:hypothetical protein NHX12_032779, partial [Muraenolepis orangiensis]
VEKVNCVIETGITVRELFVQVQPLMLPATKITLSNVPPFITDEFLSRELSRHETHSDGFNETDWKKEWEGEVILSHNTSRSGGVGFPLSKSFKPVSLEVEQFINGRLLLMLLREPLIHNARLDISNSGTPGLTVALCRTKTLCLQQLVDAVGPELSDAQALGSLLGLHSVRVAQRILQLWSQILCPEEKGLLRSYGQRGARPDPADPFPEIYLSPGLGELT